MQSSRYFYFLWICKHFSQIGQWVVISWSCAIPPEMYKLSEAVVRIGEIGHRGTKGKEDPSLELEARRGETHSLGNS